MYLSECIEQGLNLFHKLPLINLFFSYMAKKKKITFHKLMNFYYE